jgi:ssDNA-binding replication factor A large subunit
MTQRSITGPVKDIIEKSGYISRCSECNRVVHNGHCVVHVDAELEDDLRVKARVNSYDNMFIINGDVAEDLLELSTEEAKEMEEEKMKDLINEKVVGQEFNFQGKALGDNFIVDNFSRE